MTSDNLLSTDHVSAATRAALNARLAEPGAAYAPRFFAPDSLRLLEAVAARLLPQPERAMPIPLVPAVDGRLAEGRADGWRYDALPPDREAYRLGLGGIQEIAQALFEADFEALPAARQDTVLAALAGGSPPGPVWQTLPAARFFEELLAELTEIYYAHPWAQDEIGYVGYADLPAWTRVGLNQREAREN